MKYFFEWDTEKANSNFKKHKVKFEVATTIFRDPNALTIFDDEHSEHEDRWITIGITQNSHLILVVHTFNIYNKNDIIIRIISARKASKNEMKFYKGG